MIRTASVLAVAIFTVVAAVGSGRSEAHATSPGANGKIAFASDRDGNSDIYVMNSDGSAVVRLTTNPEPDVQPVWSPDGTQIAYTSVHGDQADVYVMNADGTAQRRITTHPANDASPTWSPDGGRLTYDSDRTGNYEVFVINVDGTGEQNISNHPADDSFPAWSPDGSRIAFESTRNGTADLFTMRPDGSDQAFLYGTPGEEYRSDYSPNGSQIVFMRYEGSGLTDIWLVNSDGSGAKSLTSSAAPEFAPSWTADGSEILFARSVSDNSDVYRIRPNGSGEARITNDPAVDAYAVSQPLTCTIATVTSGETFSCTDGRSVRMLQADAPNLNECGGDWAHAALQYIFLTPGRVVRLQYDATKKDGATDLAAPIWIGDDGAPYNLSIVMVYVGLAKAAVVGSGNSHLQAWAGASQTWAQTAQWNMWAPGKPYTGGC